jgi:hypothetical protein
VLDTSFSLLPTIKDNTLSRPQEDASHHLSQKILGAEVPLGRSQRESHLHTHVKHDSMVNIGLVARLTSPKIVCVAVLAAGYMTMFTPAPFLTLGLV